MNKELALHTILLEGTYDGAVIVKNNSFNGKVIKLSRSQADKNNDNKDEIDDAIEEISECPGVYMLLGQKADEEEAVYVGQSDDVYKRLNEHISDYRKGKKSFYWTTAVIFARRLMDSGALQYLEHRFRQIVTEHGRYACLTSKTSKHQLEEYLINELEDDLEMIKIMVRAVGCEALTPISIVPKHSIILYLTDEKTGVKAKGFYKDEKFIVKKGSVISDSVCDNLNPNYLKERRRLQSHQNGTIKENVFTKDCVFENITTATDIVCGKHMNAKGSWKTAEGISLKDCNKLNVK